MGPVYLNLDSNTERSGGISRSNDPYRRESLFREASAVKSNDPYWNRRKSSLLEEDGKMEDGEAVHIHSR